MKLLLVDGHYYVYRSFFAIRDLTNSRGEPTNAIFGFTKALRRMVKDLKPDLGAVIWDEGLPERRTQLQPEYKQHRDEMPAEMVPQLGRIRELCPLLGFQSVGVANTEADDVMACYAVAAAREGMDVVLATNDKDLFQLVDGRTRIYSTAKADLKPEQGQDFTLLGPNEVEKKWGVPPARILDVLALTGDSADNIPGVPGVGAKTAAKLIRQFGSAPSLVARLDEVENEKLRARLRESRDRILQNLEMVRLDLDLELPAPVGSMHIAPRHPELLAAVRGFEFRSLSREIEEEAKLAGRASQGELF